MKEAGISLSIRGAVASIIVDRKAKRNAMPLRSWLALPSLIASAEREAAVKLIVLRGAGGNFGAGNDISEFGALRGDPAAAAVFGRRTRPRRCQHVTTAPAAASESTGDGDWKIVREIGCGTTNSAKTRGQYRFGPEVAYVEVEFTTHTGNDVTVEAIGTTYTY